MHFKRTLNEDLRYYKNLKYFKQVRETYQDLKYWIRFSALCKKLKHFEKI